MGKRERHFEKVAEYKARFGHLSTEMIRYRLNNFASGMYKEAVIALRELLKERAQGRADDDPGPPTAIG